MNSKAIIKGVFIAYKLNDKSSTSFLKSCGGAYITACEINVGVV